MACTIVSNFESTYPLQRVFYQIVYLGGLASINIESLSKAFCVNQEWAAIEWLCNFLDSCSSPSFALLLFCPISFSRNDLLTKIHLRCWIFVAMKLLQIVVLIYPHREIIQEVKDAYQTYAHTYTKLHTNATMTIFISDLPYKLKLILNCILLPQFRNPN